MSQVASESIGLVIGIESTLGTPPTTGGLTAATSYMTLQVNPGGITGAKAKITAIERDPLSPNMTIEEGEIVGIDAAPQITIDFTYESMVLIAPMVFRSNAKSAGGTGQFLFRPTAVTSTVFTVGANGALAAGTLVIGKGFTNAANNGIHVVGSSSTGTSIPCSSLVAEASPPANATLEVAGYQGVAGDIQLDGNGNITSQTVDLTSFGLQPGQRIRLGGATAISGFIAAGIVANGKTAFVSGSVAITTHLITLERRDWTPGSADTAAAQTIQLLFSAYWRMVAATSTDYLLTSATVELDEPGPGAAGVGNVPIFTYWKGLNIDSLEITAALRNKITMTIGFVGTDIPAPVLTVSRVAGCAAALLPNASALFNTAEEVPRVRLASATGDTPIAASVNSWKLMIKNNVKARFQQGSRAATGVNYGKFQPSVSMQTYFDNDEGPKSLLDNRNATWDAVIKNGDGAFSFNLPAIKVRKGDEAFAANEMVTIDFDLPAHRDKVTNVAGSMSVFAYFP